MAKMATQVEDLLLEGNNLVKILEEDQFQAIFQTIFAGPGKLKKMILLCQPTLHTVNGYIMASAVNNHECFENHWPGLRTIRL